jgi:hypothetical protein
LDRVFTKIEPYIYEGEYRICVYCPTNIFNFELGGFDIPINIKELIDKIYISPFAEDYFRLTIEAMLKKYLGEEFLKERLGKSIIKV